MSRSPIPGFETPLHRALTEPVLMGGCPRAFAILNGTLAGAIGLGLRLWLVGLLIWVAGHALGVWLARKDPAFPAVFSRHARHKGYLSC